MVLRECGLELLSSHIILEDGTSSRYSRSDVPLVASATWWGEGLLPLNTTQSCIVQYSFLSGEFISCCNSALARLITAEFIKVEVMDEATREQVAKTTEASVKAARDKLVVSSP